MPASILNILQIHTSAVDYLLSKTTIEDSGQGKIFPLQRKSTTENQLRIGIAQVNDILFVDDTIFIDILILGITRINQSTTIAHSDRLAIYIIHYVARSILGISFVGILIYALVTITIESTNWLTLHNSHGIVAIAEGIFLLSIVGRQHLHLINIT